MSEFESIVSAFAIENGFSIRLKSESNVELHSDGLKIFITNDEIENQIHIDFDIDSFSSRKTKKNNTPEFPLFLDLEFLYEYLGLPTERFLDDKTLLLRERILGKCSKLKFVWNYLQASGSFRKILKEAMKKARENLKQEIEREEMKSTIDKANQLFKKGEYQGVVDLLLPVRVQLQEYEGKILAYCLKKMK